jgi:c(7)-type cytochrome triheme protein
MYNIQKKSFFLLFSIVIAGLLTTGAAGAQESFFKLPRHPAAEEYGNILINRNSGNNNVKPVTFSHWLHRTRHTCRVCHLELEFNFKTNSTAITEKENVERKFCGACHDGKTAFGHTKENCDRCHNGNIAHGKENFRKLAHLPKAPFGNGTDWSAALRDGVIKPVNTLQGNYQPLPFDKKLVLAAEMFNIPAAVFPHEAHTAWLDCANCHPDIFNIKKKTTEHFSMSRILKSQFCGVCHLKVAFPLDDCGRCHP